jgi:hypothetical protein
MKLKFNDISLLVIFFGIFKLLLHLITNTNYGLHRDAYLYYSLGENIDWGFMSVPPLIGVIAKFSTSLFGNTVFGLRFFPALVGSISVFLIAGIVKELKGGKLATIIAILGFIFSPALLRSNSLFQPVSFNQFFWLLSGYLIIRLINTRNRKTWLGIFLVFALGFLNKYSIIFFGFSILFALLISKHRNLIHSKYFYVGLALAFVTILPNLFWQYHHNWPVVTHMVTLQKTQLVHVSLMGFVMDQLIMNLPGIFTWATGLVVFLFFPAEKKFRFVAIGYVVLIVLLIIARGKGYYTIGYYSLLFALGGYAIDKYYKKGFKYGIIVFNLILIIPMMPMSLPVLKHEKLAEFSRPIAPMVNRWEDGKIHAIPQDFADMTGWEELADMVIEFYKSLPEDKQHQTMIFAENYGQAGAIYFHGKQHGLPQPASFDDNFIFWAPESIEENSLIYIGHDPGQVKEMFGDCKKIGEINNIYFRENGVMAFYCKNPVKDFNTRYQEIHSAFKRPFE